MPDASRAVGAAARIRAALRGRRIGTEGTVAAMAWRNGAAALLRERDPPIG
jgi:hypothetical protein